MPELRALGRCALVDGSDFEDGDLSIDGRPGPVPRLGVPWWTLSGTRCRSSAETWHLRGRERNRPEAQLFGVSDSKLGRPLK